MRRWLRGVRTDLAHVWSVWRRRRSNRRWVENHCPHGYGIGDRCGLCGGVVMRSAN
jgi:hypothetical protein